jgi:hypothetical protein
MRKQQKLVLILLGIADVVVLGCLALAMVFGARIQAFLAGGEPVAEVTEPSPTATFTVPATWTPSPVPTRAPTDTSAPSSTPTPTRTSIPTFTPSPIPSPSPLPIAIENAGFEEINPDNVPGWEVVATVNWQPGDDFNADSSFARPEFKYADDSRRIIQGDTLQIQTFQWVKFSVTLYQVIEVPEGSQAQFQIYTNGYASTGGIQVKVGIDPSGGDACQNGRWSEMLVVGEGDGVVQLTSPPVTVGEEGAVTVCFFAEPQYAAVHSAAFFDVAELSVAPPE